MTRSPVSVTCDGLDLACEAWVPDADPRAVVVLLHGIPSTAPPEPGDRGYAGLAEDLGAHGYLSFWGDMRGARGAPGHFSIEGWVRDASAFVAGARALAPDVPLALVGSSAGGAVSVAAVARGTRVDALALLAAPAEWVSFAADGASAIARISEGAGMAVAEEVVSDPSDWVAEFERVTTVASIASVDVPLLIMHGTGDDVVPVDHASRIAERARHAELVVLPGAPHQLRRHPEAVRRLIDWLGRTL